MAEIIALAEHRPHLSGDARCLACHHEWVAVAPVGTHWLECPVCRCERGTWKYPVYDNTDVVWECRCGNRLFHASPRGVYCPCCGTWQTGF